MAGQRFITTSGLAALAITYLIANGSGATPDYGRDSGRRVEYRALVSAAAPAAEKPVEVRQVYTKYCQACHGADGKGTDVRAAMATIPDFTSRKWQDSASNVQIKVSILEGKGTLMPPFRDKVSDDENRDLTAVIREFAPK